MKKNHKASGGKADEFLPEPFVLCYGDEENARIYAVHLTTANQSEIRRAHLVSVFANFQIQKSHSVGCKTLILCLFNSLLLGKMVE